MMAVSRPGDALPEMLFSSSRFCLQAGGWTALGWWGKSRTGRDGRPRLGLPRHLASLQACGQDERTLSCRTLAAMPPACHASPHPAPPAAASPALLVGQSAGEVTPLQLNLIGAGSQHAARATGVPPHLAPLSQAGQPLQPSPGERAAGMLPTKCAAAYSAAAASQR